MSCASFLLRPFGRVLGFQTHLCHRPTVLSSRTLADEARGPQVKTEPVQDEHPEGETFASLLRNCKFTQLGDPVGKVLVGRIYHIVNDDLYIDLGHKFPCVCKRPRRLRANFVRGTQVRVLVKSLEMSEKFMGFDKEMTLMEADGILLGLNESDLGRGRRGRFPRTRGDHT